MQANLNAVDRPQGMRKTELEQLCSLVETRRFSKLLEVGMANGSSSVALLRTLARNGGGSLTSIDPYQYAAVGSVDNDNKDGYSGEGMENVRRAGFAHMHTLMAEPDYTALPKLVVDGEKFDFIFIDGYHSFDHAFVDFFYADLLLEVGGMVAFHDSSFPAVYKVCRFIERNKDYKVTGPRPEPMYPDPARKALRRIRYWLRGENVMFRERRLVWCSLAAFEKLRHSQCKQFAVQNF